MTDSIETDMAATLAASPTINDTGKKAAAEVDAAAKNAVEIVKRSINKMEKLIDILQESSDGLQRLIIESVATAHDVAQAADEMDRKIQSMMQEKK